MHDETIVKVLPKPGQVELVGYVNLVVVDAVFGRDADNPRFSSWAGYE